MEDLLKDFIPYDRALRMKALGFDKPCFGRYGEIDNLEFRFFKEPKSFDYGVTSKTCLAPTFPQAFRWFREKHDLTSAILPFQDIEDKVSLCYYYTIVDLDEYKNEDILCNESSLGASDINFSSYEKAELACLDKLIEIVEQK